MKRPVETPARIWLAIRRIEARGERPTQHSTVAELRELYGSGGSFRDVAPIVAEWRAEQVRKGEKRIQAAVAALVELAKGHPLELEEVARRFRVETNGDRLSLQIKRKRKSSKSA